MMCSLVLAQCGSEDDSALLENASHVRRFSEAMAVRGIVSEFYSPMLGYYLITPISFKAFRMTSPRALSYFHSFM